MKTWLRTTIAVLGLLPALGIAASAQQEMSLKACLDYGKEHNTGLQRSRLDVSKTEMKVMEGISGYLPQINATGTFNDNLKLPTQIIPGEIFGQPGKNIAVQFGTTYNVTGGIDVQQVIYNQSILTGIKAAKASRDLSNLSVENAEEQLIYNIASAYYSAQITAIQRDLIIANLTKVDTLLGITKARLDRGFAKKTDYDRLAVNQTNLKTELQNLDLAQSQQLVLLKFHMGMALDSAIALPKVMGNADIAVQSVNSDGYANITDLKLLQMKIELTSLSVDQINAGYLPTLSMSLRMNYQAQQNNANIFASGTNWFPTSVVGLTLNVPIFDGLNKMARAQQARVDVMQLELDRVNLEQQLKMQSINARNKMEINLAGVTTQRNNMNLADEVYQTTQSQFQGGIVSLTELFNAETALREAQVNYVKSVLEVRVAELDLLRSSGNIKSIHH